ncbi:hypothetical protein RQP46_007941 [Phenoliferia psychrophenolica]
MSDLKPTLPFELTEKILELATTTLVEQERHDSTLIGQTNAFLLAASLVSHTWRNIAQPLLLKHGLVTPASIYLFTYKLKRAGVLNTHTALWTMERLEKLTTHLPLLRNSSHWYPPNLKAVKLLRNFNSYSSWRTTAPEGQVMGIVRNLAKLKELEVPDCWRSDKVEAACEARGIALTWSADCTSSQIFRNLMHI